MIKSCAIKNLMEEDYACQYANLKNLDCRMVHLEEWTDTIWKNWSEIHQERICKIKKETKTLLIEPRRPDNYPYLQKSDTFGQYLQNDQWSNNLKRHLEESTSEDELPNISYKTISTNKETFRILVDGNEKINGNPFKAKTKKKKVRFSENHELSDGEIMNEIEKTSKL
ncbi:hypothetical protein O181_003367 [Austropuccinia psidii MF-1]|uniref:Uncharacterized protein n=1 Tax=Austropuccinia psidii MF-1 TaxID=1389203 RepID=A0A9Q3BEP0_9BASI|nr:hypothetical protein [Austropuccinia psidii MF-1]